MNGGHQRVRCSLFHKKEQDTYYIADDNCSALCNMCHGQLPREPLRRLPFLREGQVLLKYIASCKRSRDHRAVN